MPSVDSQGVQIHYEVAGRGDPLLLVHGMFVNWKWWRDTGFVQAMQDTYRLVMLDVRGHGLSEKPHEPDLYKIGQLVGDLISVLDQLEIKQAHYLGYSMGGWIGLAAMKHAPERFRSFILGGIHPYLEEPGYQVNLADLPERGIESIVAWFEETGLLTEAQKIDLLSNDVEALVALTHHGRADYSDLLPELSLPCLLYCGDADIRYGGAKRCAQELPGARFVSLPGHDHMAANFRGHVEILPHIADFLSQVKPT